MPTDPSKKTSGSIAAKDKSTLASSFLLDTTDFFAGLEYPTSYYLTLELLVPRLAAFS